MPHDSVAANGAQFDFDFDAADEETYSVHPPPLPYHICVPTLSADALPDNARGWFVQPFRVRATSKNCPARSFCAR